MSKKTNNISLVIIAKNEEKGLERAILSCKDFVDKILISVDTKCTDGTLEIAKKYADLVIRHEWEDDFAKARNNVQQYVKTKWSLMLDGHEYVKEYSDLEQALKSDVDGLFVKIEMEDGFSFYFPRIYKSYIKYKMAVHNYPDCKTTQIYKNFVITHDRPNLQEKTAIEERTEQRKKMVIGILQKKIKENKKDDRSLFYLAQQYRITLDWKKSIKYYKQYLKYSTNKEERWLACYYLGTNANMLNKPKLAIKFFKSAEKELSNRWEISKRLGTTYIMIKKYKRALDYLVNSFTAPKTIFIYNPEQQNNAQTWFFISQCFFTLRKYEEAKIALARSLKAQGTSHWQQLPEQQIRIAEEILGAQITPAEQKPKTIAPGTTIEVCLLIYKRYQRLPEILNQLKAQTIQNFKINIWNNSERKLDISNFPQDRINLINSNGNIGSQARFRLAKETTGKVIIFFDDDENLFPDFIEYHYNQYLKFGPECILGYFTRTFDKEKYWDSAGAPYGSEVDYIATKAMILDRKIIDDEPLLQDIPEPFTKVEDLYLCYLARTKHRMRMIKINPASRGLVDNQDQYIKLLEYKEEAFRSLRQNDWWLIKDNKRKVKLENYDREIWVDTSIKDNDVISRGFLRDGRFYEEPGLEIARQLNLDPQKAIVDVGANIGNHTMFFSLFCPHSKIFAFEPYKKVREVLKNHIRMNELKNVNVFPYAVGSETGFCDLEESPADGTGKKWDGRTYVKKGNSIKIITLDEMLKDEPISFIKIDVEEYEYNVLLGATNILKKQHPYLFIEAKFPDLKRRIDNYLSSFGYKCKKMFNPMSPTYFYTYEEK